MVSKALSGSADSVGSYVVHAVADPDEQVLIPDDRLRARIQFVAVAVAGSQVTTGALASLQAFDAPTTRIADLSGFDAAVNLVT